MDRKVARLKKGTECDRNKDVRDCSIWKISASVVLVCWNQKWIANVLEKSLESCKLLWDICLSYACCNHWDAIDDMVWVTVADDPDLG